MFMTQSWMQPLEPVHGVKVTHRIHVKVWHIATDAGVLTVELNWQTGDMVAHLRQNGEK
jgi:hypothetical protein